jgi:hypothetical protein
MVAVVIATASLVHDQVLEKGALASSSLCIQQIVHNIN